MRIDPKQNPHPKAKDLVKVCRGRRRTWLSKLLNQRLIPTQELDLIKRHFSMALELADKLKIDIEMMHRLNVVVADLEKRMRHIENKDDFIERIHDAIRRDPDDL